MESNSIQIPESIHLTNNTRKPSIKTPIRIKFDAATHQCYSRYQNKWITFIYRINIIFASEITAWLLSRRLFQTRSKGVFLKKPFTVAGIRDAATAPISRTFPSVHLLIFNILRDLSNPLMRCFMQKTSSAPLAGRE